MNYQNRSFAAEKMDNPDLDFQSLREVYADINKVNKVLNGFYLSLKAINTIIIENPSNSYTILDMGCGDGSMLREVASHFKNQNIELKLIGVDLNSRTIKLAKEYSINYPNISFFQRDILALDANDLQCDILLCTLTMHHFNSEEIPVFLNQFVQLSRLAVVINDLHRSKVSFFLFRLFSLIFIKTGIAKHDGLVSIKSAFVKSELEFFSRGLPNVLHDISWRWAFRYLWVMRLNGKKQYL